MAGELLCGDDLRGLVDPGYAWQLWRDRWLANEALWMSGVVSLEDADPLELDMVSLSEMEGGWCMEADARMAVVVVVPLEEPSAERAAIVEGAETVRELWSVFESLV